MHVMILLYYSPVTVWIANSISGVAGGSANGANVCQATCKGGTIEPVCSTYPCLVFEDNFDVLNHEVWEHEITASGGGVSNFVWCLELFNNKQFSYPCRFQKTFHNKFDNSLDCVKNVIIKTTTTEILFPTFFLELGVWILHK